MASKPTKRPKAASTKRAPALKVKVGEPPWWTGQTPPLTLMNLRLGLAGRRGQPLRQQDVAKKAKIHHASLSNIERGAQPASQFLLFKLSEIYQVDLEIVRSAYDGSRAKLDRKAPS